MPSSESGGAEKSAPFPDRTFLKRVYIVPFVSGIVFLDAVKQSDYGEWGLVTPWQH